MDPNDRWAQEEEAAEQAEARYEKTVTPQPEDVGVDSWLEAAYEDRTDLGEPWDDIYSGTAQDDW